MAPLRGTASARRCPAGQEPPASHSARVRRRTGLPPVPQLPECGVSTWDRPRRRNATAADWRRWALNPLFEGTPRGASEAPDVGKNRAPNGGVAYRRRIRAPAVAFRARDTPDTPHTQ